MPNESARVIRARTPRGQGRARLIEAASQLFVDRGVNGTSLQAIADELGVTKAAVYHLFATKDEIVLAVAGPVIHGLSEIVTTAESIPDRDAAVSHVVSGLTELVVAHRRIASLIRTDPAMMSAVADDASYASVIRRIDGLLLGPDPSVERRIAFAFAGAGAMAIGWNRSLDSIPDEVLRENIAAAFSRALDA